jgi:hypothetical protein
MINYRSFYTIAYLGCPLGFQAFARGRRGCGPQATYSPTSIVCRSYALIQRVAPGPCTQSCCSVTETGKILTNEQKVSHCPFCCLCCRPRPSRRGERSMYAISLTDIESESRVKIFWVSTAFEGSSQGQSCFFCPSQRIFKDGGMPFRLNNSPPGGVSLARLPGRGARPLAWLGSCVAWSRGRAFGRFPRPDAPGRGVWLVLVLDSFGRTGV